MSIHLPLSLPSSSGRISLSRYDGLFQAGGGGPSRIGVTSRQFIFAGVISAERCDLQDIMLLVFGWLLVLLFLIVSSGVEDDTRGAIFSLRRGRDFRARQ